MSKQDVSIIIPVFNGEKTIIGLLESIDEYVPKRVMIIIIDDCSSDSTLERVAEYKTDRMIQILPLMERGGPANARNAGVANSSGDIMIFLDSDTEVTKDFFREILRPFLERGVVAVQGVYENANKNNIISQYEDAQIKLRQKPGYVRNLSSYALAVRRKVFVKAGGFDTKFPRAAGEDTKLGYDLSKHGRLFLSEKAVVRHHHNTSVFTYFKKQFHRSRWRIYLYRKHPGMSRGDDYSSKRVVAQPFLALGSLFFFYSLMFGMAYSAYYWVGILCWDILLLIQAYELLLMPFNRRVRLITGPLNVIRAYIWCVGMIIGVLWVVKWNLTPKR